MAWCAIAISCFAAGLAAGAVLVRYGMGVAEKMFYGARDGVPVLSRFDPPLAQAHTGAEPDEDEELEVET